MGKALSHSVFLFVVAVLLTTCRSEKIPSSQSRALLRIKRVLGFPGILSSWNKTTDFCGSEPSQSLTVICYGSSVTQLHIIGSGSGKASELPLNFSVHSFFNAVAKLQDLRVLTLVSLGLFGSFPGEIERFPSLEILNLTSNSLSGEFPAEITLPESLRTLILDDNELSGRLPRSLFSSLSLLTVLSLRNNSFNSSLPLSLSSLQNLRVLVLSRNEFAGEVPDLSGLANLQSLELNDNAFVSEFPRTGKNLVKLDLSNNGFRNGVSPEIRSYRRLRLLNLANNSFVGPFPQEILTLPSINFVDVEGNRFTGMLLSNQSCNPGIEFLDLSSNLFTGVVPDCLLASSVVSYANNCLSDPKQFQNPLQHCRNEALAVGISPVKANRKHVSKAILAILVPGCAIGAVLTVCLIVLMYRRQPKGDNKASTRSITDNTSITGYTSRLLSDTRFVSQTASSGALGLPGYRTFLLEELQEATNNFDASALIGGSSHGQMFRGFLKDGSCVAIRSRKMETRIGTHNFMQPLELISKLRHKNLVSVLGHCFECHLDDSTVSRVFLVYEYVQNGTLRSWISEEHYKRPFSWTQRISTAMGIAKGIQYLHTGVKPGIYRNNLTITDVLIDHSFNPKISSYNVSFLDDKSSEVGHEISPRIHGVDARVEDERIDVYDFGVILLEIIKGRHVASEKQVDALIEQIEMAIGGDKAARRRVLDRAASRGCVDESVKTMMEICVKCLAKKVEDRASVEDILWNLQYASQVQDAWRTETLAG